MKLDSAGAAATTAIHQMSANDTPAAIRANIGFADYVPGLQAPRPQAALSSENQNQSGAAEQQHDELGHFDVDHGNIPDGHDHWNMGGKNGKYVAAP